MTSPAGKPATIAQKARRKISLPWFRQSSVTPPHATLARQHTIDTPGSFQARLLRRQPSLSQTGVTEMTWVVADHLAAPGSRELTVTKGQQVEVLENGSGNGNVSGIVATGEWTLVRLPLAPGQTDPPTEGLVPTSALKQPPSNSCKTSPSRKPPNQQQTLLQQQQQQQQQQLNQSVIGQQQQQLGAIVAGSTASSSPVSNLTPSSEESEIIGSDGSGSASTSSPGNKRRGFSGRKWLPPPLRKLSQGKVDKVVSTPSSSASTAAAATVNSSGIPLTATSLTTVTTATTTTATTTAISSISATTPGTVTPIAPTTTPVKQTTTVATVTPSGKNIGSLKKSSSDKRFKLPSGAAEQKRAVAVSAGNIRISSELETLTGSEEAEREEEEEEEEEEEHGETSETISTTYDDGEGNVFHEQNGTEDGEDDLELPPPMKPITEPILVAAGNGPPGSTIPDELPGKRASECSSKILDGATTADLAEIEQIVKERMEQHTENQERHSLMRTERTTAGDRGSSDGENNYARATSPSLVTEECDPETAALTKRQFVIRELVETERDYVNDLKQIVEGYMTLMRDPESDIPLPEDLRGGKDKMVFGNIEAIYEWHRDFFLKALENCIKCPEELGPLFKRYERKLHMYVVYCQNKPVSEYIVSEYIYTYFEELRQKLKHRLQLCDLLIKPVQRITKYQLLLREALRLTERTQRLSEIEGLRAAVHVMRVIPKAANDMMDVGRLQGFDGKITAQGKLLLHGPLLVSEISSVPTRGKEWHVFLFEQNIIFSEAVGKKTQFTSPAYIYKAHIQVNKMSLEDSYDDPDKFVIRSTDPRKPGLGFYCSVVEENGPRRQEWVDTITAILQTQRDFLKALQSPIAYQKELTKDPLRVPTTEPVVRETISVAPTLSTVSPGTMHKEKSFPPHQKITRPIQRTQYGGLDCELPRTPSPTKSRLNFLDGFRNTLRARSPVRTNSIPQRGSSPS